jgi:2-hydroxychromene-2-carboxylate isomerase
MARPQPPPRVYFSFRSPYSWLAYHDLTTRHPDVAAALQWRPFWEPDERSERMLTQAGGRFVYTPMSKEKHLYVLSDVRRLAQRRGLPMVWPIDREPCWEVSHLPYFLAADRGLGMAYVDAVYRARWREGRDVCDVATIADVAEDVGLDRASVEAATGDDELRARGVAALLDVEADGVFGVPFFVIRRQKFWGVDRLLDLVDALAIHVDNPARTELAAVFTAGDTKSTDDGHAGGCG